MPEAILITGGCGFIGSHLVREALARGYAVVTLDALTYAATRQTLSDVEPHPRHRFVQGSIGDRRLMSALLSEYQPVAVVNVAAATHVDRSIDGPRIFLDTNVRDVFELLEAVRQYYQGLAPNHRRRFRFLQVSTDEVFGPIRSMAATEISPHRPSSPYSATKAAADNLVHAWGMTYGLPTLISHCTNNYGPYQFPEKLIPHMILRALRDMPLPLYGDGLHRRDWLHVTDHVSGLFAVLTKGSPGGRYNLASGHECTNLELVRALCRALDERVPRPDGQPHSAAITFVEDRPGHDRRYSLDITISKRELGFAPTTSLDAGLGDTVDWYIRRADWWRPLIKGDYALQRLGTTAVLEGPCDVA